MKNIALLASFLRAASACKAPGARRWVKAVLSATCLSGAVMSNVAWSQEQSMSPFLPPAAELLSRPVAPVPLESIRSAEVQQVIDQMYEIAAGERTPQKMQLVGLAAPQIGIDKAIILVDMGVTATRTGWGELKAFINPQIVWYSEEQLDGREGCFSVDQRVAGVLPRAARIRVSAFDRNGEPLALELEGFTARIFQHEVDHLNGIRFPDRVRETGRGQLHWVETDQYPAYRVGWETWPTTVPESVWLDMKAGRPVTLPLRPAAPQSPQPQQPEL